jgi:septum formation protein
VISPETPAAEAASPLNELAESRARHVKLVLASASPRRAALLREAGYTFIVEPARVDEEAHVGTRPPAELAGFLADIKADEVAARFPDDVTLAADTVVALEDVSLGKPTDAAEARGMIRSLRGTTHDVFTGVAVRCPARGIVLGAVDHSIVRLRPLSDDEVDRYVASGRWVGKAGGYGIQDPGPIVACERGSISNVIGLPMELAERFLSSAGVGRGAVR